MDSGTGILTLSQLQARELAGKRWLLNGSDLVFADYDRSQPGQPPWKTGAEGIAYPLIGADGQPRAYVKFFDELKVTAKRIARTEWLIEQSIDNWAPELRGAPNRWLDTQSVGRPAGAAFDFTCSMAQAVPGKTWLELKLDIMDGAVRFEDKMRQLCAENLIRGLVYLERAGMVHGDLSPNNVIVNLDARSDEPTLYLIDFDGFFAEDAGSLAQLSIGEGGTYGTRGYCPPELEHKAQQNDLATAPFSDRYGRDMLLVELLCFDEECDFEDPASEWSTDKIQRRLSESAAGEHLRHLVAKDVFQLPENQRPTGYDLARMLRMTTPPRIKGRGRALRRTLKRTAGNPAVSISSGGILPKVVVILWALCLVHWGLVSFWGAAWLLSSPATQEDGGIVASGLSLAARGFVGLGMFLVGAVGLSILAFAEDQPRLISFGGFGFRIPARWNQSQPYSQHVRIIAGALAGILAVLALLVMVQAVFL
jgi:hypothetical protein